MESLKITLVQTIQHWENKEKNLLHFSQHLDKIDTTDLVLFPEMFHTGFSMNAENLAEEFTDSLAVRWLTSQAIQRKIAIYTSFICKENGHYFNRGLFVFPDGKMEIYDKRKLFTLAKEELHYSPGKSEKIVEYKGFKLFLSVCYDLRFPEIQRNKMVSERTAKYDVLLNVANWPERRNFHWKSLMIARAIENQCYFVGVNRVGTDENQLSESGDSRLLDPFGVEISHLPAGEEAVETIEITKEKLFTIREKMNFLKDFEG